MRAPERFQRRIRAIHPDLYVEFLEREGCWAVCQKLANTPSLETMVERAADETRRKLSEEGRMVDRDMLGRLLYPIVAKEAIVFRVIDPATNTPLPLDERVLTECRKRAWKQRHMGFREWRQHLDAEEYELDRARRREVDDAWTYLNRDPVAARIIKDATRGLTIKHTVGGPLPAPAKESVAC